VEELVSAGTVVGWRGQDLFDALATRTDADPDSKEYKLAYKAVWGMLTRASMEKVTHAKGMLKTPQLGSLWDMKENEGKDIEPGTFAELLRYGSLHFQQTRETISFLELDTGHVLKKGMYEA
jgi:hypothetical protein